MIVRNKDGNELHLYRVEIDVECYVLAEDESEAERAAKDAVHDDLLLSASAFADEITDARSYVDPEWLSCEPYGQRAVDENGEEDEFQIRDLIEMIKRNGPDRQLALPWET